MTTWFSESYTSDVNFTFKVQQIYSAKSKFQKIEVFETKDFGRVLVMDDRIMLTEKDEQIYHEMIVHVPLAVHTNAQDVLIIGGGDGGALRELTRYKTLATIDMVEIDSMVPDVAQEYFPKVAGNFLDSRFNLMIADGLKYVRSTQKKYDLILVDSTDPFGPGESLFTREFYGNCYDILREDGVLVNQHESPYYKSDAREVKSIYEKTISIFPIDKLYQAHIPTYPSGHWLFGFLSKKYDPLRDLQVEQWSALDLETFYYNLDLHRGSFALPNYVLKLIDKI
ncbi:MAG: polyamine aminopropyltransferase [Clostridiaceae bacterium]|jgi:spermidine synthase|nr:polyamine aminopropyltransferase [Clostridiaceae bacterium]